MRYKITQEQFELLQHFKRMFELNAENIKELCSGEKSDIAYGFELGRIYASNRDFFIQSMELEIEIRNQEIIESEIYKYGMSADEITFTLSDKKENT